MFQKKTKELRGSNGVSEEEQVGRTKPQDDWLTMNVDGASQWDEK